MSHALKTEWKPSASIECLKQRAKIIQSIRHFFIERDVLEVDTPLLARCGVTDPYIESLSVKRKGESWHLQTSPEYAMKRLLAFGSGDIFQICKAFREDETGRWHCHEFTMLEWYRVGFDHHQLMDDMDELLQRVLKMGKAERVSYQALFETYLNINPHHASFDALKACALSHDLLDVLGDTHDDKDDWLNLLLTHVIEPQLGFDVPVFIYDYPASQSALAKVRVDHAAAARDDSDQIGGGSIKTAVAERFEVYVKGIELANGFHELQSAEEQLARFNENNRKRQSLGLQEMAIDHALIAALAYGLPTCAGVALGVDRLVALALKEMSIKKIIF